MPAAPPAASPAPVSDRPDYIPEKFWDPAAKAPKIEDLGKSYAALETKFGKGKEAFEAERLARRPEAPDRYEFAVDGVDPEEIKAFPLTQTIREVAFELGLAPEEAQGVAGKIFAKLIEHRPDPVKEKAALGANADQRLAALDGFLERTFTDPAERKAFEFVGATAAGVRAVEKLVAMATGQPPGEPLKDGAPGAAAPERKSKKEIDAMMQDRRYWHPKERDEAFVQEVQAWFQGA